MEAAKLEYFVEQLLVFVTMRLDERTREEVERSLQLRRPDDCSKLLRKRLARVDTHPSIAANLGDVLTRIDDLAPRRNRYVHGAWFPMNAPWLDGGPPAKLRGLERTELAEIEAGALEPARVPVADIWSLVKDLRKISGDFALASLQVMLALSQPTTSPKA
jgi:hypothetical protein